MDKEYGLYCFSDPLFYDSPMTNRADDPDFEVARRPVPAGWERAEIDDWLMYFPSGACLPPQGWKVHAAACIDTAADTLAITFDYCVSKGVPFKFVRSRQLFVVRNLKYADRGASGKLVTIYPADEAELEVVLTELGALLAGRPGPYILSDLRWGEGPLYVRYGGFAERYCAGPNGELQLAIEDPTGELVPDVRTPTFQPPPWVTLPDFLAPHLAARNAATMEDLPYVIDAALHFSNGGGVYGATDTRNGERVVLKEARPYAGLAVDGADAVTRLGRERDVLDRLAGLDVVPALRDYFTVADHHFLVEEFVEGRGLHSLLVERYPLVLQEVDEAKAAEYTAWALDVFGRLERAVAAIHERGVVIGDLHPSNVLVRPDGRVVVIDLEVAADTTQGAAQTLADPAFIAPAGTTGPDLDRYALACLRLFLFLPVTTVLGMDPGKSEELAAAIAEVFPVPPEFLAEAVRVITTTGPGRKAGTGPARRSPVRIEPDQDGWARARASMAAAITASATPSRDDRLYPGDVKQFAHPTGGLGIAHGAAGVLFALATTGCAVPPDHVDWLVRRATRPERGSRVGLYDGLHGAAYVLERLGRRDAALEVLQICVDEVDGRWDRLGLDLQGGLAGIGLNLAHFAARTGDAALWDATAKVVEVVADRLGDEDGVPTESGGSHPYAGLVRGSSGPALLFLRMYERSGDDALLDLAATALGQDLRRCVRRAEDDSLEVDEGWRTMPYVADGSVGIGVVLDDFLLHRQDERLADASRAIQRAAEALFYIEPGLYYGRAGMILYLSRKCPPGTAAGHPVVAGHIRRLAWHALSYQGHLAFPGDQLMRLSMDLATGNAGILLALGAALHDQPVGLPFLGALDLDRALDLGRAPVPTLVSS